MWERMKSLSTIVHGSPKRNGQEDVRVVWITRAREQSFLSVPIENATIRGRTDYDRIDRGRRVRSSPSKRASTRMVSTPAGTVPSKMRPMLARRMPVRIGWP